MENFGHTTAIIPGTRKMLGLSEEMATKLGFSKGIRSETWLLHKRSRPFVLGGGYLFAMCSATDSYDVAMAAHQVDICDVMFDGDPMDPNAQSKLDYDNCVAFHDFSGLSPIRQSTKSQTSM